MMRVFAAGFVLCLASALLAGDDDERTAGRLRKASDPAEALGSSALTDADEKKLAALFERLASDDFDERQRAQEAILSYGPRAASVARKYEGSEDADTRQLARRFQHAVILGYRGYLPVAPELRAALAAPRRMFIGKRETFRSALERFLRDSELNAAFTWKNWPERIIGGNETFECLLPTGEALQMLLAKAGTVAVPRGAGLAVATPEQAAQLFVQEREFAAASIAAKRTRFAELLGGWLPQGAKVNLTEAGGIGVRGREGDLRLAARAIYFVAPDAIGLPPPAVPSRIFPAAPERAAAVAVFEALEAQVSELSLPGIEPLRGIARLRAAGHPLSIDESSAELSPRQPAVTLELRELPLGMALRWMMARANKLPALPNKSEAQARLELQPAIVGQKKAGAPKALIVARLTPPEKKSDVSESVLGADIAFLYTEALAKLQPAEADKAAAGEILKRLGDELALFPAEDGDIALFVFERRLLVRGPELLLARLEERLESWRAAGPPPRAKWRSDLEQRLEREIDWNGTGLTAQTLLPRLREATGINVMLERDDGVGAGFEMEAGMAELLPPGKHRAKELLNRLATLTTSFAVLRWGTVTLIPAQEIPQTFDPFRDYEARFKSYERITDVKIEPIPPKKIGPIEKK